VAVLLLDSTARHAWLYPGTGTPLILMSSLTDSDTNSFIVRRRSPQRRLYRAFILRLG